MDAVASVTDEMKIEYVSITDVQQHPNNANNGDMDAIKDSIRVNGLYQPIIVQKSTGYILAGNHRYMALYEHGEAEVPVIYVDVDDLGATRIMLADNRTARLGNDDPGILADLLQTVYNTDEGLAGTGYSFNDYDLIINAVDEAYEPVQNSGQDFSPAFDRQPFEMEVTDVDEKGRPMVVSLFKPGEKHMTKGEFNAVRKALGMAPMTPGEALEFGFDGVM